MKASKLLMSLFALSMLTLAACSQNKDSGATVRSGYYGTMNGGRSTYGTYGMQLATVSGLNVQGVMSFLSAGGSSDVGSIQAVQIAGSIGLACSQMNQPIIANGSNGIVLNIIDNLAASEGPIQVFMPLTQGNVLNGQMNLYFADNVGSVTISGNYTPNNSAGTVQGTISFQNNGGGAGTIGSFQMPISAFLKCQQ